MSFEHSPNRRAKGKPGSTFALRGYTIGPVAESEGVSVATIRRWVREGKFPKPVKISGPKGRCVWYEEVLTARRAAQIAHTPGGAVDSVAGAP